MSRLCSHKPLGRYNATVQEAMDFIKMLEYTLREGVPQEKLVALRQCVDRIWIDHPSMQGNLQIKPVPTGQLEVIQKLYFPLNFVRPYRSQNSIT